MNANRTYAEDFLGEMSPAGQRVQQTLSPYQQFRVSGTVTPPNQSMGFDDPLGAFESLDPADDSFLEKQSVIFQSAPPELFRNPAVQNRIRQANAQHAEAQSYFKEDPELVDFYISQVQSGVAPAVAIGELRKRAQDRSLKGLGLKSGLLEEEYESLRDPVTKQVDKFKMMDFINRADRASKVKAAAAPKPLSAEGMNRILSAEDALEAASRTVDLSDENKKAVFKKEFKRLPTTAEDWDRAYELANRDVRTAQDKVDTLKKSYSTQYQMPPELQPTAQAATQPSVQETVAEDVTPTQSVTTETVTAPAQPAQREVPFTAPVTLPELTETDKIASKLSDDDIQAFTVSGTPDNPSNPLDVEQSAQAQELEMANLLSKAGLEDNPESRRKVLLAVEAKSDPSVVRLGGKVYRFKDADTASEFRKRLSQK